MVVSWDTGDMGDMVVSRDTTRDCRPVPASQTLTDIAGRGVAESWQDASQDGRRL